VGSLGLSASSRLVCLWQACLIGSSGVGHSSHPLIEFLNPDQRSPEGLVSSLTR
jgi:hypothetical protein